jgi:hypothetical protein
MDGLRELLSDLKRQGYAKGNFLGLLNVVIGRRIQKKNGPLISDGVTWRELAEFLQRVRWPKEAVRDLGLDPDTLPPRNRRRYWYAAISQAGIASEQATQAGNQLARVLHTAGYIIGPGPASAHEDGP